MNAADVVAYVTEGQIICTNCAGDDLTGGSDGRTPDEVGVIFADADVWESHYCDGVVGCGHSLTCTTGVSGHCEKCFPTSRVSSRAVRKSLPEDCRKAVTRAMRECGAVFEARVREGREVTSVTVGASRLAKDIRRELEFAGFRELDSYRYEWTA